MLTNVNLRQCVEAAYGIQDPELVGPDWLESTRFDIQAKPPVVHPKGVSSADAQDAAGGTVEVVVVDRIERGAGEN